MGGDQNAEDPEEGIGERVGPTDLPKEEKYGSTEEKTLPLGGVAGVGTVASHHDRPWLRVPRHIGREGNWACGGGRRPHGDVSAARSPCHCSIRSSCDHLAGPRVRAGTLVAEFVFGVLSLLKWA